MAIAQRLNIEERQRFLALKDLHRGDLPWHGCQSIPSICGEALLTFDNLAEDARHY